MKKHYLLLVLFINMYTFAQIKFEKAYFISNTNQRVECLVKNIDWKNSPNSFEYKINEQDEPLVKTINDVKLFEVYNQGKFVSAKVKIDQSSSNINRLSKTREPEFVERHVFVKELTSGNIKLYGYKSGNLIRYFYQVEGGDFEPLINKSYEVADNKIMYNNDYQRQLRNIIVCPTISDNEILKTNYNEKDLKALLNKYYKCTDPNYKEIAVEKAKGKFNLNIRPRVTSSSVTFTNQTTVTARKMDSKVNFSLGIEAEYVLPFNKNKWSIIAEPTYQSYKADTFTKTNEFLNDYFNEEITTSVIYKSIEIPIGVRHYLFLNDQSKLFINAQYNLVIDLPASEIESKGKNNNTIELLKIDSRPNFSFGIGYNYKNKYGIEARVNTSREMLNNLILVNSEYKSMSLILSYNIF